MSLSILDRIIVISLKLFETSEESGIQDIRDCPKLFKGVLNRSSGQPYPAFRADLLALPRKLRALALYLVDLEKSDSIFFCD